ncbi:MAG: hypothetical protein Q7U03_12015 [Syntrophales bacterium]|nr:hypothetical protein [Syntrophales bacterium]
MVTIKIHTKDPRLVFDIFDRQEISINDSMKIDDNSLLTLAHIENTKGISVSPGVIEFVLSFSSGVASGLVANWLWNRFNKKADKITINDTDIIMDKDGFIRIITKEIKKTIG